MSIENESLRDIPFDLLTETSDAFIESTNFQDFLDLYSLINPENYNKTDTTEDNKSTFLYVKEKLINYLVEFYTQEEDNSIRDIDDILKVYLEYDGQVNIITSFLNNKEIDFDDEIIRFDYKDIPSNPILIKNIDDQTNYNLIKGNNTTEKETFKSSFVSDNDYTSFIMKNIKKVLSEEDSYFGLTSKEYTSELLYQLSQSTLLDITNLEDVSSIFNTRRKIMEKDFENLKVFLIKKYQNIDIMNNYIIQEEETKYKLMEKIIIGLVEDNINSGTSEFYDKLMKENIEDFISSKDMMQDFIIFEMI